MRAAVAANEMGTRAAKSAYRCRYPVRPAGMSTHRGKHVVDRINRASYGVAPRFRVRGWAGNRSGARINRTFHSSHSLDRLQSKPRLAARIARAIGASDTDVSHQEALPRRRAIIVLQGGFDSSRKRPSWLYLLVIGASTLGCPSLRHHRSPRSTALGRTARTCATIGIVSINTRASRWPCAVRHRQSRCILRQKAPRAEFGCRGTCRRSTNDTYRVPRLSCPGRRSAMLPSHLRFVNHHSLSQYAVLMVLRRQNSSPCFH
jgi:hypothetical protein